MLVLVFNYLGVLLNANLLVNIFIGFGGCIKNIRVNRRPYSIEENAVTIVTVNMDGCPALAPSSEPCKATLTEVIYQGQGNTTYDYGQLPFTGMYSCYILSKTFCK